MNENCLWGFKCPKCGSNEPFYIIATIQAKVWDDGTEECGDTEWDDDSYCRCCVCDHEGKVGDFQNETGTTD